MLFTWVSRVVAFTHSIILNELTFAQHSIKQITLKNKERLINLLILSQKIIIFH